MEGKPAIYLGRIVSKENFRTFIYAPDGSQKLVESWEEFEGKMQSGVWFATAEDAKASMANEEVPKVRTRAKRTKKSDQTLEIKEDAEADGEIIEEDFISSPPEDVAFEVTDDFLPKGK
jgi:hypothetical protein